MISSAGYLFNQLYHKIIKRMHRIGLSRQNRLLLLQQEALAVDEINTSEEDKYGISNDGACCFI